MKKLSRLSIVLFLICLVTLTASFAAAAAASEAITVSAAISLKNAFEEIGKIYEPMHHAKIIFNFGASGNLLKQIAGGAPVDIFASAAKKDMDEAEKQGFIIPDTRTNFAGNEVVLIVPADAKTSLKSFEGLSSAEIKRIAAGNPKTVPAGRYADEVFHYYNILDSIKEKLIFTENVRQALDYVVRGEVDAGVVYATDAAIEAKTVRIVATAPESSHKPVIYPIAVVKGAKNKPAAMAFIALLQSAQGKEILKKYGFQAIKK
jgi:molybdate transport system substrate-binding protein